MNRYLATMMATVALFVVAPAVAQPASPISLTGSAGPFVKEARAIAIPAYHVTFITQKQGTAAATSAARTRLNVVLTGIDEALMRQMADEAHADLVAQLSAAGVPMLPAEAARALAREVAAVPGNGDVHEVQAGITIGRSLKHGYAAYGATAAPMLVPLHNPGALDGPGAIGAMNIIGAAGKIGNAAAEVGAAAIVPNLMIDFLNMNVRASSGAVSVGGQVRFAIRQGSGLTTMGKQSRGSAYAQGFTLTRDVPWDRPFAMVDTGGAAVRTGTMTAMPDRNYIMKARARGDAIQADPMVWTELVREAYRAYNAAVTAQIVRARR